MDIDKPVVLKTHDDSVAYVKSVQETRERLNAKTQIDYTPRSK